MPDYVYTSRDKELKGFADNFENRVGDGSGLHDRDYFDMMEMLLAIKSEGVLLDIGAGLGRVVAFARDFISQTVALEPDRERWKACHDGYNHFSDTEILCQTTSEYIADNPDARFDVIVLGMVIQHMSTTASAALLEEVASLLKDDGVAIIYTTHGLEETRGFGFSASGPDEMYVSEEEFNRYAEDHHNQDKGLPVRRFSQREFTGLLEQNFEVMYWRQVSYYRSKALPHFANRLQIAPEKLKDIGNSQFAVVKRR